MHDPNMANIYADHRYFIKEQKVYDSTIFKEIHQSNNVYEELYDTPLMELEINEKTIVLPRF